MLISMGHIKNHMLRCLLFIGAMTMLFCIGTTKQALSQEKTITLATMNWEPVYGESLPEGGVFTALTRETFRRVGYQVKVQFVPWKRAIEFAKRGRYDGLMGALFNAERKKYFTATEIIMPYEAILFSRKEDEINYTKLLELKPYVIGDIRGAASGRLLQDAGLTVQEATKYDQNIKKLMTKRIDLMICDKFVMPELLKKLPKYQGKIKALSPPVTSTNLYILISKKRSDHAAVAADFNRGLQSILNDGTFESIVKKFGFSDLR